MVKNWTLLYQQPCGIIICFIITLLFTIGVGQLHLMYVDRYDPYDDDSSDMVPTEMPIQGIVSDINHHMLVTLSIPPEEEGMDKFRENFGTLPEDQSGTGFWAAADKRFSASGAPQFRNSYTIPSNVNTTIDNYTIENSTIPFATVEDIYNCSAETGCKFMTFEDVDQYQNKTSYELMAQDIEAEHYREPEQ